MSRGTGSVDDLETTATTLTGQYRLTPPDLDAVDLTANLYFTRTRQEETRIAGSSLGQDTVVEVETPGFDLFNTARFNIGDTDHALTVGGDGFKDTVTATRDGGSLGLHAFGRAQPVRSLCAG